jgi:hypothetical protein
MFVVARCWWLLPPVVAPRFRYVYHTNKQNNNRKAMRSWWVVGKSVLNTDRSKLAVVYYMLNRITDCNAVCE